MNTKLTTERGGPAEVAPRDDKYESTGHTAAATAGTLQFRRIMVPTDFSPHAAKALDYVRALAQPSGAEVVLVHVIEPAVIPDNFGIVPPAYEEMTAVLASTAEEKLNQLAAELAASCGAVKTVVRTGRAPWEVVRLAEDVGADLIIITTHGYTGLKHALLGSTAELIVRHAPCPVLTIRRTDSVPSTAR